jgi:hypothetical protein
MRTLESLVSHLASDTPFRAALAARGLTLTDAERELVEHLRPLLALPADALLQRLLDDPDGDPPWQWDTYPPLVAYLE